MGSALIVDAGVTTLANTGDYEASVPTAPFTFTVRNSALTDQIQLIDAWRKAGHAGRVRVTSPKLVPVSNGILIGCPTGLADFLLPGPPFQALTPQDALTVQDYGTAADVDVICLQSYYANLPASGMLLKMPGDISGQTEFVFGWPVVAPASGTAGTELQTVITTTVDSSTANRYYAVLGYVCETVVAGVGIIGVDTSQLYVGGPGDIDPKFTRNYFVDLSMKTGLPCIPLFNAANKANTFAWIVDNVATTGTTVTFILAELNATYQP